MTESMDATDYAFYLAYGMTPEDETLQSLLDVEMYNMIDAESSAAFEARDSSVLRGDTSEAKATRVEF
jgi:hypothetical protein